MLYDLYKTYRGKTSIVMTDTFGKVRKHMEKLRSSQVGTKVQYEIGVARDVKIKFKKKPTYHGSR